MICDVDNGIFLTAFPGIPILAGRFKPYFPFQIRVLPLTGILTIRGRYGICQG